MSKELTFSDLATKEDLQKLEKKLDELLSLLKNEHNKKWFKSDEAMKILGLSYNTLTRLRESGEIESRKMGGTYFYKIDNE